MYFKRLEMHGFKSFAEPAVIEFHEGVTCIVGPNGSGKSNISDAIRWVLGEQSPKMLRGGKMEEVIFAGTANRKSRGMAEVTLVIDNTEGRLPIDYNEVAITRRMYRSGESEYLINNNQCRLRDIRELIMDTGIGVDGYSIIGQGKIADIVSSKPESRREIFEEAAGVVMYKSKKAESERKLSSATANLERVDDIINEIESRIDNLRDDSVKAQEYLELKDRFKDLEINITLRNIEKLEETNNVAKDDLAHMAQLIEKLSAEKKQLDDSISEDRTKNDNLEQLSNKAKDRLLASVEEINSLTNKSQLDAERLNSIDKDITRVGEEIISLGERKERELSNAGELEAQKKDIEKKLIETQEKLDNVIKEYELITETAVKLAEETDECKNKMYSLFNKSTSKTSEAKSLESYKESLKQRKQQLVEEETRLKENEEASKEELKKYAEQKEETRKALISAEGQVNLLKEQIEKLSEQRKQLDKQESHLQIQISQFNGRKKTIEEMEANYEGYNGAVKFIMKSGLKGIEGVAADLMKVPSGFETAVETALGAALQNIICLRDEDAKKAVKALKDNKAGRLTFLPVESVRGSKASLPDAVISHAGFKGIGSDLVQYDEKYEGIFRYLLGRTAIVATMQDAIDFSKKTGSGVRFVTLEGEVVNASGAITGGRYKNATANLLERKGEIQKLAHKVRNLEEELFRTRQGRAQCDSDMKGKSEALEEKENSYRELQLAILSLESKIETAKSFLEDMSANGSRHKQQIESIDKDQSDAEAMAVNLEREAEECRSRGKALENKIEELMCEQEKVKVQVDDASDKITAVRIEKNSLDGSIEGLEQMLKRIMNTVHDFNQQIDAKEEEIAALREEKERTLFGTDDAEELLKSKVEEKTSLEEYISKVSEERSTLAKKLEDKISRQVQAQEKLNAYQDQKYREEIKLAKNETQLDTFKEKLWEDFEISYLQAIDFKKSDFVMSSAQKESREIRNRLKELGDVNVGAIEEYAQVSERYEFLTQQRKDITEAMEQLRDIIDDMEKTIKSKFKDNFDKVVVNFEKIFKAMFGGGHAELRLDNENDPLEAGIEIIAQPPGKKLQNINLMSGGEKTMTAIALMFAVLQTTPTPFCILDEVEAALDDMNIERFARYLRSFHDIQFAIITHQKATMEYADVLYGITMPERGVSKVLSLRLGDDFQL